MSSFPVVILQAGDGTGVKRRGSGAVMSGLPLSVLAGSAGKRAAGGSRVWTSWKGLLEYFSILWLHPLKMLLEVIALGLFFGFRRLFFELVPLGRFYSSRPNSRS